MFDAVAAVFLRRGLGNQERPIDPVEFRRLNAVYHMAMVYRRLISVGMELEAEILDQQFRNVFGEEYETERARVIQEEPDTPEPWLNPQM